MRVWKRGLVEVDRPRRHLVLVLEDDRGNEGHGEASPLEGRSVESLVEVRRAIDGLDDELELEPSIAGIDALADRVTAKSARFALETALSDLLAKREGIPVAALYGVRRSSLDLCQLLEDGGAVAARTVKLKASGRSFDAELLRLERFRLEYPEAALRVDWNRSLGTPILERLERLARLEPAFVEEPTSFAVLSALGSSPVPIALDESLAGEDPDSLVSRWSSDLRISALVLKPMILGGARACRDLGRLAMERGLDVVISHAFDGPVAHAMASAIALSMPGRVLAPGLWPHAGLSSVELPHVSRGAIRVTDRPGLGLRGLL